MTDEGKFPSIDISLAEVRRRYDDEERRRISIEAKFNGLLALNGVFISLMAVSGEIASISSIGQIASVVLILASVAVVIHQLRGSEYHRPIHRLNDFSGFINTPRADVQGELINQYIESIENNQDTTNGRFKQLWVGIGLTITGLVLFASFTTGFFELLGSCLSPPAFLI